MGIAAGMGFISFVAYATVRSAPLPAVADSIESQQEQLPAAVAGADPLVQEDAQAAGIIIEPPSVPSEPVTPIPAVVVQEPLPAVEAPQWPDDKPADDSRYEEDEDEDDDEDD